MEKLEFSEETDAQKAEKSRGSSTNLRTKNYIKNGIKVLVVLVVLVVIFLTVYIIKTAKKHDKEEQNAPPPGPPPSNPTSNPSGDDPVKVDLILLHNATRIGAVCLDGSAPGYHLSKGFDSGSDNWLIHIEGGGMCSSVETCSQRMQTPGGSSKFMDKMGFGGILSSNKSKNPEFYNWNRVKVRYCDGAFFSGSPNGENETTKAEGLFFRGQRIWDAVMAELLDLGMIKAKQAFLTGCSAGGIATLVHCDSFAELFTPGEVNVKCLSDAGFFIDEKAVSGAYWMRSFFHAVVNLQGMEASLNKECISELKESPSQCLFPQNFVKNIKTPVFLVNPSYDALQIEYVLLPPIPDIYWANCTKSITQCDPSQLNKLHGFRNSMLNALSQYQEKKNMGMFIDSCFAHCQTDSNKWHLNSPRINNKTIAEEVGDWYFNRKTVQDIDNCKYPCNPTCSNKVWE
ncbi:hypothetical protein MKW92_032079 [Papaver armeniacum]|nr:hypothetical protein MKW92_032079 [Papaver armeniacum]